MRRLTAVALLVATASCGSSGTSLDTDNPNDSVVLQITLVDQSDQPVADHDLSVGLTISDQFQPDDPLFEWVEPPDGPTGERAELSSDAAGRVDFQWRPRVEPAVSSWATSDISIQTLAAIEVAEAGVLGACELERGGVTERLPTSGSFSPDSSDLESYDQIMKVFPGGGFERLYIPLDVIRCRLVVDN